MTGEAEQEVRTSAEAYCKALHAADGAALKMLCHEKFLMTFVGADGAPRFLDRDAFVARVASRAPFEGTPSFGIETVDVAGPEIAHVRLWVDVPPRRFRDYLGFFRVGGEWRLITKLFRTVSGPAMDA